MVYCTQVRWPPLPMTPGSAPPLALEPPISYCSISKASSASSANIVFPSADHAPECPRGVFAEDIAVVAYESTKPDGTRSAIYIGSQQGSTGTRRDPGLA